MREILFRGKRTDNGEWVYGFYAIKGYITHNGLQHFILDGDAKSCVVDSATIGQYTGLIDNTGTKIFEGDIIEEGCNGLLAEVFYNEKRGCYALKNLGESYSAEDARIEWEVIGNIHDNPELIRKD